jgi:hypothetical protein
LRRAIIVVKSKLSLQRKRHRQVALTLLVGNLLVLSLMTLAQGVDWGERWASILLFAVLLALAGDLGLASPGSYNGLLHAVMLAAALTIDLAPTL